MPETQRTGRRLILMDGTEIENGHAGTAGSILWLWLPAWTMAQAAEAMIGHPEKTGHIVAEYGEMSDEYEGYTNCTRLTAEDGEICVGLTRG